MRHQTLRKRAAALALAAALLLPTGAAAAFTDTEGHWAASAIAKWSEEYGLITGYDDGTFRPDQSITRGAFAGILDRVLQYQSTSPAGTFSDTAGAYWESAILKLNAAGVYLGDGGRALLQDPITRQQAVTMVARAFAVEGSGEPLPYSDAGQVASYAAEYLSAMTAAGDITDAADGAFRPTDPLTRAELVNLLNNLVDVLIQETEIFSRDVEGTLMLSAVDGGSLMDMRIGGDLIIAPGVSNSVTLTNVTIGGQLRNLSDVQPTIITIGGQDPGSGPETPQFPTVDPSVYPWVDPSGYVDYNNYQVPLYPEVEASRVGEGDFFLDGDRMIYTGGAYRTRFGIDVSSYQSRNSPNETIDWEAVAADGVEFAMVRIGLRGTGPEGTLREDAFYRENLDGAMAAGLDTGVYFFSQATSVAEAEEEADMVIRLLEGRELTGPVAYDWEMKDSTYRVYGTDPRVATAAALAFCQRIESAGYQPMLYVSNYVGYNKFNLPQLSRYPIWYPQYKVDFPKFYYQMDYWQFGSDCAVDGIGGRVDANLQFLR